MEDSEEADTNGNHILDGNNDSIENALNKILDISDDFETIEYKKPFTDLDINKNNQNKSLINNVGSPLALTYTTMCFLDESGSVYNSSNIVDSPSYHEKNIRLTDLDKGLEVIGRKLAAGQNVGWKEYWEFLGTFVDINSDDGLRRFENFLKLKEKTVEKNEHNHVENAKETNMEKNKVILFQINSWKFIFIF